MTHPGPPNTPPGADSPRLPKVIPGNGYVPPESTPTPRPEDSLSGIEAAAVNALINQALEGVGGGAVSSVAGRTGDVTLVLADIDGLDDVLNGKADAVHTHPDKADTDHGHTIADVTNLQTTLNGLASSSHTHTYGIDDITGLTTALAGKADTSALSGKVDASRTVSAGTGLTGGGDLSTNRTIALNAASIASLAKADSAVQPGDLSSALATVSPYLKIQPERGPVSYTLTVDDANSFAKLNVTPGDMTVYVPLNSTAPIPVGARVGFMLSGNTGSVSIGAESGVVVRTAGTSMDIPPGDETVFWLTKIGTDEWILEKPAIGE